MNYKIANAAMRDYTVIKLEDSMTVVEAHEIRKMSQMKGGRPPGMSQIEPHQENEQLKTLVFCMHFLPRSNSESPTVACPNRR